MPKRGENGEFAPLPSTLKRSPHKAQDTYEEALEHAEQTYGGDEPRAHRVAWSAVKHAFEKVGDHWEPKAERGPSDPHAVAGGPNSPGRTYGGIDVEHKTKAQLSAEAERLGAHVTARMTKAEIVDVIEKANARATRRARSGGRRRS